MSLTLVTRTGAVTNVTSGAGVPRSILETPETIRQLLKTCFGWNLLHALCAIGTHAKVTCMSLLE